MITTPRVYTGGTFDLFHYGHVNFLKQCARFGNVTVALNTDEFIEEFKGSPPVMNFKERKDALLGCRYVDEVVENFKGADSKPAIIAVAPSVIIIGSDWYERDYFSQMQIDWDFLRENNIALMYIPYTITISTTDIKKRLLDESGNSN